jgi:hypothetical protein
LQIYKRCNGRANQGNGALQTLTHRHHVNPAMERLFAIAIEHGIEFVKP